MTREDRKKASDVFRETNFLFAKKTSFAEAFPEILQVTVEVEESGTGVSSGIFGNQQTRLTRYTETSLGEYADCSNRLCFNGGIDIGSMLREAVREQKTEFGGTGRCQGYEGSPGGRRKHRECMNYFKVRGEITYKGKATAKENQVQGDVESPS
jgi:hypothetical protein